MMIGVLIIVAPLFWFSFMGSMGIAMGDLVSSAITSFEIVGDQAATTEANIAKSGAASSQIVIN